MPGPRPTRSPLHWSEGLTSVLRGLRSWLPLIRSPCTPGVCWGAPGRATRHPLPRKCRRRWSSWCRPGCRDCRCSEEGSYCRTDRHHRLCESLTTHLRSSQVTWPGADGWPKTMTYSLRMSSSVNGTSSISTADLAVKKIPNIACKRAEERCSTWGPGNKRRPQGETLTWCQFYSTERSWTTLSWVHVRVTVFMVASIQINQKGNRCSSRFID